MNYGDKFEQGIRLILDALADAQRAGTPAPLDAAAMRAQLDELAALRGRPAFYPYLGSGLGRGARAMLAFRVGDGALENTRGFIRRCFDAGLVLYYGGDDPACIRLFMPAGCLTDDELADAFAILDRCLAF
jgi:4-aminobutyrate aminotransferase-like enzyme